MSKTQARAHLAYGYTFPIAGAALATVVGLMLNDSLPQRYETWTWVVVQLVLGIALVFGTRFSALARNFELASGTKINANGARVMNFVLSIIWSAVVVIMSLTFITGAVNNLKTYSQPSKGDDPNFVSVPVVQPLTTELLVRDFIPAILILAITIIGTLLWLVNRAREK